MGFALSNVVSRRAAHLSVEAKTYSVWLGTTLLTAPLFMVARRHAKSTAGDRCASLADTRAARHRAVRHQLRVQYALAHLPANRAIILFLFELVVAATSSYFFADEAMQLRDWLGAALIVSASLLSGKLYAESK